jgi:signal transduction histidine kinase
MSDLRALVDRFAPTRMSAQIALILIVGLAVTTAATGTLVWRFKPNVDLADTELTTAARIAVAVRLLEAGRANADDAKIVARAAAFRLMQELPAELAQRTDPPTSKGFMRQIIRDELHDRDRAVKIARHPRSQAVDIAVATTLGAWAVFTATLGPEPQPPPSVGYPLIITLIVGSATIAILCIWVARLVAGPLSHFAEAAERLGREGEAPNIPVVGPREVRRAAHTFNVMQQRLRRFVDNRAKMLAGISHDLRTPITRLRLRAEEIEDTQLRRKFAADLARMEAMVSSALGFLREEHIGEAAETIDLAPLLQTICDDLADLGYSVDFEPEGRVRLRCRARAMERALANVVGNAAKFGGSVQVTIASNPEFVIVTVDDDGPGIRDSEKENVFEPFYRSDQSREATEGVGLGLSIARTIVHAHGGDIQLDDRHPSGLRVRIVLPRSAETPASRPTDKSA